MNNLYSILRCFFLFAILIGSIGAQTAFAQKQRVAVLPSIADSDTKLSATELDVITEKIRGFASELLPLADFILLKQDSVKNKIGDEAFFKACKEGACIGDLIAKVNADFGARCDVYMVNNKLWLKFELFGTLKGEDEAGTIATFSDGVKDFNAIIALLEKRVPDAFKKILPSQTSNFVQAPPAYVPVAPSTSNSYLAEIVTEPAGAALNLNGQPLRNCPRTPCRIELYENRINIQAMLNEYETADTSLSITQHNQLVTIKLKPKTYYVNFTSEPYGAVLNFSGSSNYRCTTPCGMQFKKGDVKVRASSEMYETVDTMFFVNENGKSVHFELKPNWGTLEINPAYTEDIGKNEQWKLTINGIPSSFGSTNLLPGNYGAKLSHSCYEDIEIDSINIKKDEYTNVYVSDKLALKKGDLVLNAKYKWKSADEPIFVNGKQVGETPFKGSVPLCSEIEVDKQKIDVGLKHNESVEYTHKISSTKNTLLSLALGIAGGVLLYYSAQYAVDADDYYQEYSNLQRGEKSAYDRAYIKIGEAQKESNTLLIIGGVTVVSAIGVYIWF